MSETPVIFRLENDNVIAIFPTMPGTDSLASCLVYSAPRGYHTIRTGKIYELPSAMYGEYISLLQDLQWEFDFDLYVAERSGLGFVGQRARALKARREEYYEQIA